MDRLARRNSEWQGRLRRLLREGLGSEDIARLTETKLADVQREISILRETGELKKIYERQVR